MHSATRSTAEQLLELRHLIGGVEVRLELVPKIQTLILTHLGQDRQPAEALEITHGPQFRDS